MASRDWDDTDHRTSRARELLRQQRWADALAELRAVAAECPFDRDCLLDIAEACDELGHHTDAHDAYEQALGLIPEDAAVLTLSAACLHRLGRSTEALERLDVAERLDPSHEPIYCLQTLVLGDTGRHDDAEAAFYLGRLYREHCPACYHHVALSLAARGKHARAIYCWRQCLKSPGDRRVPPTALHHRLAESLREVGDHDAARAHLAKALQADEGNVEVLRSLAQLLIDQHRLEDAAPRVRRVVQLAPEHPASHLLSGRLLLRRGQCELALRSFERSLQLDPTYPLVHFFAANACLRLGDRGAAVAHLRREMALRPDDAGTLNNLANILIDSGDTESACTCLRRAVRIEPSTVKLWQNLGVAECLLGRHDAGIEATSRALSLHPESVPILHNLALAEAESGRLGDAWRHARRAIALAPGDQSLYRLRFRLRALRVLRWLRLR